MRKKIFLFLNHFEEIAAGVLFTIMVVVINVEVIRRYLFLAPGAYSEEIAKYLFIWTVFFSMAFAVKQEAHIITDILPDKTPNKLLKIINITSIIIFMCFSVFMIYQGYIYTKKMYLFERSTEAMAAPLYYFCVSLPIGFAFVLLRLVQKLLQVFRGFNEP